MVRALATPSVQSETLGERGGVIYPFNSSRALGRSSSSHCMGAALEKSNEEAAMDEDDEEDEDVDEVQDEDEGVCQGEVKSGEVGTQDEAQRVG